MSFASQKRLLTNCVKELETNISHYVKHYFSFLVSATSKMCRFSDVHRQKDAFLHKFLITNKNGNSPYFNIQQEVDSIHNMYQVHRSNK